MIGSVQVPVGSRFDGLALVPTDPVRPERRTRCRRTNPAGCERDRTDRSWPQECLRFADRRQPPAATATATSLAPTLAPATVLTPNPAPPSTTARASSRRHRVAADRQAAAPSAWHDPAAWPWWTPPAVRRALRHIHSDVEQPLTLDELANAACMSRYHFARVFRDTIGKPPHQYVLGVRIERAKERLVAMRRRGHAGAAQISTIAFDAGFSSPSQFSATFKRVVGTSPSDWLRAQSPG